MYTVNYPNVINCEYDKTKRNKKYRKSHRNSKRKPMKANLYTNSINLQRSQIALTPLSLLKMHDAIER